jgi:hypothetical protein
MQSVVALVQWEDSSFDRETLCSLLVQTVHLLELSERVESFHTCCAPASPEWMVIGEVFQLFLQPICGVEEPIAAS